MRLHRQEPRRLSLAGCTSIEHGDFLNDDTLKLLAQRGTYLDPNFLVLYNYLDDRPSFGFAPETFDELEKSTHIIGGYFAKSALNTKVDGPLRHRSAESGAHGRNAEEFIYRVRDAHEPPMETLKSATSINGSNLLI